jgi:hypothetical protein
MVDHCINRGPLKDIHNLEIVPKDESLVPLKRPGQCHQPLRWRAPNFRKGTLGHPNLFPHGAFFFVQETNELLFEIQGRQHRTNFDLLCLQSHRLYMSRISSFRLHVWCSVGLACWISKSRRKFRTPRDSHTRCSLIARIAR